MGAGSKAPMDFLNKKGWHPGSFQNQQKKWKLEQEALAEQKRVEELRKEQARDRERHELDALATAAGAEAAAAAAVALTPSTMATSLGTSTLCARLAGPPMAMAFWWRCS